MRDLVKAAKALSDEIRLRILSLLLVRECCVCEVMQVLSISQSRASRNLNLLHDGGFLKVRREGLWAYYSVDKANLEGYLSLFVHAIELRLSDDKTASADKKRLKEAERLGPQCCAPVRTKPGIPAKYTGKQRGK